MNLTFQQGTFVFQRKQQLIIHSLMFRKCPEIKMKNIRTYHDLPTCEMCFWSSSLDWFRVSFPYNFFFGHVQFFWCFCAIIDPRILIIPNIFQIHEISGLFGHITLYMFSRSEAEGSSLDFSGLYWISNFIHTEASIHVGSCFWFTLGQLVYQTLIFTRLLWLFRRISYAI